MLSRFLLIVPMFMTTLSCGTPVPSNPPPQVPLQIAIQTPHPGFGLEILRVDRLKGRREDGSEARTLILARIRSPEDNGMMFPMVISEISDTVYVPEGLPPAEVFVVGRTWNWGDEEAVPSEAAYQKMFQEAEPIPFTRPAHVPDKKPPQSNEKQK